MLEEFRIYLEEPKLAVSNFGKVFNLSTRKFMYLRPDKNGYLTVRIANNRKEKTYKVHRLVGFCFLPPIEGKTIINHKDGNPSNNSVTNLEWCTQKENVRHAVSNGTVCRKGSNNSKEKLNENTVHIICQWFQDNPTKGASHAELVFNVSYKSLVKIRCGESWKDIRSLYKIPPLTSRAKFID